MKTTCPICGAIDVVSDVSTRTVAISRCRRCGHRVAMHPEDTEEDDYHRQYEEGEFLASLEATRRRQAQAIICALRERSKTADRILDFGCGRGWFLDECRSAGATLLAGADTSPLAIELLTHRGIEGLNLPAPGDDDWSFDPSPLSFDPCILTLLDVVEHFPADRVVAFLESITATFPSATTVVMKVPVSSGFLFRTARALASARVRGPYEQLYQAGTFPPHFHYFSRSSARALLEEVGFHVLKEIDDLDFEPRFFGGRVKALAGHPFVAKSAGYGVAIAARALRAYDSIIFLAERQPHARSSRHR